MISKIDDVFYLDIPSQFGSDDENDTSEEIEAIMDECDKNVECRYGASKFIMLFDGSDKIVKIPMNGTWFYNYDDNDSADYDDPVWEPFATADYCALEALIYEAAVEAGLEMFFASTVEAGRTSKGCGIPYYISEKVNTGYDYDREPSEDSKKKAREMTNRGHVSVDFVADALDFYGETLVQQFLEFVREWDINDLHDGNIGYRNDGSPVLLDYSGFRS